MQYANESFLSKMEWQYYKDTDIEEMPWKIINMSATAKMYKDCMGTLLVNPTPKKVSLSKYYIIFLVPLSITKIACPHAQL